MCIRKLIALYIVAASLFLLNACDNNGSEHAISSPLELPIALKAVVPLKIQPLHLASFAQQPIQYNYDTLNNEELNPIEANNAPPPASKEELANLIVGTPFEAPLNNDAMLQQENLPTFQSAVQAFYAHKNQQ